MYLKLTDIKVPLFITFFIALYNSLFTFFIKIPRTSSQVTLFFYDAFYAGLTFIVFSVITNNIFRSKKIMADILLSILGAFAYTLVHFSPSIRFQASLEGIFTSGLYLTITEAFVIYTLISIIAILFQRLFLLVLQKKFSQNRKEFCK